jgi:hypothetical protein
MTAKVTDEMLMAYVDGELDHEAGEDLRKVIAADQELAARAEAFRSSRRLAKAAFEPELAQPVPARLIEAILADSNATPLGKVVRFPLRRTMLAALPLAASLAVVFGAAGYWYAQRNISSGDILGPSALAVALAQTPAGDQTALAVGGELATVGSYRIADGVCRVFEVAGAATGAAMRGVGCARGDMPWSIDLVVTAPDDETYTPASFGLLDSIDAYLDALEAEPLTAEEERMLNMDE